MTHYKKVNVSLNENQIQKLQQAIKANCSTISLKLGRDDLEGEHPLYLTNSQYNKLQNAKNQGKGLTIRISSKQLKYNMRTEGGIFRCFIRYRCSISRPRFIRCCKKGTASISNWRTFRFSINRCK